MQGRIQRGSRPPPLKIGKNKICWRKIVIFHTKYLKKIRAPLRSCAPLTWNPGSAPDSRRLMSTAAVLPLSTAEVERVFSQVKLVKCDHINRMKQVTMNNMLHVKLNCNKQCYEHVSDTVVAKFFRVNDRKIELYLGWFVEYIDLFAHV